MTEAGLKDAVSAIAESRTVMSDLIALPPGATRIHNEIFRRMREGGAGLLEGRDG
jgi:hypothetical protein